MFWYVKGTGRRVFTPAASTRAREPVRGTTTARVTLSPLSRRFVFRACLEPSNLAGVGPQPRSQRCPRRTFKPGRLASGLAFDGTGRGSPAYPGSAAIAAAGRYLAGRAGRTAFAIVDSTGRLHGVRMHQQFGSASV